MEKIQTKKIATNKQWKVKEDKYILPGSKLPLVPGKRVYHTEHKPQR